jgi:hypothetical protein
MAGLTGTPRALVRDRESGRTQFLREGEKDGPLAVLRIQPSGLTVRDARGAEVLLPLNQPTKVAVE